jgi:CBS domain-containing protein
MRVADLLAKKGSFVATVGPDARVRQVVGELTRRNIGAVVVSHNGEEIDGIASERDVVRALDRLGPAVLDGPISSIMSVVVRTCAPDETVDALMATMTNHRIRHLPVVERGALVGIVSIGDVVKSRMDELEADRDALVEYIGAR